MADSAVPPHDLAATDSAAPSPHLVAAGTAPVARRERFETDVRGRTLVDHYRWLHDRGSEEVRAHLEAENAHTEAVLAPVAELRQLLFEEMKGRVKETDMSVPVVDGPWAYYSRTVEGSQYGIHCRCPAPTDGTRIDPTQGAVDGEQILLDENIEAAGTDFFDVGLFEVSPDHRWLLWAADTVGDERYRAKVRDLETGVDTQTGLDDLTYGSAWALDNQTFFYCRQDDASRAHEVWRHRVGTPAADDVLVLAEPDERFYVGVGRDKDDAYIYVSSSSKVTDEIWVVPADDPEADLRPLAPRRQGVECSAAHAGDRFIILTNDEAENFRIVTAPEDDPGPHNWTELIAGSDTVTIAGFDVCHTFMTLFERADGASRMRLRFWEDGRFETVDQPENPSTAWAGANLDYQSTVLRYGYTSMVTPPSLYELDTVSGERTLLKRQEILGDFDPANYQTRREWATSPDGARVPISLVWRADRADGPGPALLYAYGAYEASMDPGFSAARLSLLDRGFCFAIAHARGGGEMGRGWYVDGKFEKKQNTFTDVIAVARHLIDNGWTNADKLVLRGGSAGGLMAGAVINQAAELFGAVVAHVPFVDALNTILDPTLPLTVTEWEEWGNPAESEEIFNAMFAYSPYENVSAQDYPSILATGGFHDTRVNYWEPAKWVQLLRHTGTGDAPILLWTDLEAGHGGPSGRYDGWRDEARILAYILWIVGLTP
jgi:oligopeptidase B